MGCGCEPVKYDRRNSRWEATTGGSHGDAMLVCLVWGSWYFCLLDVVERPVRSVRWAGRAVGRVERMKGLWNGLALRKELTWKPSDCRARSFADQRRETRWVKGFALDFVDGEQAETR